MSPRTGLQTEASRGDPPTRGRGDHGGGGRRGVTTPAAGAALMRGSVLHDAHAPGTSEGGVPEPSGAGFERPGREPQEDNTACERGIEEGGIN